MKKLSFITAVAFMMVGTSCLKDEGYESGKYGLGDTNASPVGVGFAEASNTINAYGVEVRSTPQTIEIGTVNLLSDVPLDKDISLNVEVDPSIVTDYNNAPNTTDLATFPAGSYSIASTKITITKGQRTGRLSLTIANAADLDPSKRYGLGLKITSVDQQGIRIASNLRRVLYAITVRNDYDGVYDVNVELTGHPSASGQYTDQVNFSTVNANTVETGLGVARIFAATSRLNISVDPATNNLMLSSNAATIFTDAGAVNRYDPVTRTFYFDYRWSTRRIVGTAVRR